MLFILQNLSICWIVHIKTDNEGQIIKIWRRFIMKTHNSNTSSVSSKDSKIKSKRKGESEQPWWVSNFNSNISEINNFCSLAQFRMMNSENDNLTKFKNMLLKVLRITDATAVFSLYLLLANPTQGLFCHSC